jgi:tetratricopeptide (TPR) repeat protein
MQRLQALREDQPATPAAAVVYSVTLNRLDRSGEAMDLLSTTSEQAKALGNEYWGTLATYHYGRSLLLAGRLDAAQARFDEAQRVWSANETANRDRLADLRRSLAELELARGRLAQARENIDAALVLFNYPTVQSLPGLSSALAVASRIYLRSRQLERAEVFARAALSIAEGTARDPTESADVGEALLVLAAVRRAKDDAPGARALLGRAVVSLQNGLGAEHRLTREAVRSQRAVQ